MTKSSPPTLEQALFDMFGSMREIWLKMLDDHDLSPTMVVTMQMIETPQPLRVLAQLHRCDASNMTGIADRLEERGLAERTPDPNDRRVKLLALTSAGEKMLWQLRGDRMVGLLPGVATLTKAEKAQLALLLSKAFHQAR
jgi:DNA-binding MarR family transcriptional regulator